MDSFFRKAPFSLIASSPLLLSPPPAAESNGKTLRDKTNEQATGSLENHSNGSPPSEWILIVDVFKTNSTSFGRKNAN